ncbi:alpha/beta hydrolase [Bradyrhizobium sp. CB1650]|uniref:alpha/beta fold hydrolase n=1 Tax=Bradyrhizobium sp. CB1650 TaxID=3039153 RepID=UPI002435D205|nr:alpha/beta hydrolase [Bradyrhizobium sp. CB1650]WGD51622.1 alpha/beta hydrolase [Bradyrhizobium sp. CB1650]
MSTAESVSIVVAGLILALVIGNVVFSVLAERSNAPIGRFVECDGIRLHYVERGDPAAPWVVLFHGNGSMIQDFMISGLVDHLASRNRVLCFDRPGFGHSQRPRSHVWTATAQADLFVKAFMQLGVRDPVVLGHSWGALVAIALGLRNDYPIRGLVLVSGYYFRTRRLDVWVMSGPAIPIVGDLFRYTIAPIISWAMLPTLIRKLFAPRPVPRKFRDGFPASLTVRPKQLRAAAEESALMIPMAAQFQSSYHSVRCPVCIFHGTADQISEPDQARNLHRALLRSELHLVPNAGHMVTYADTADIAEAVETVGGLVAGRTAPGETRTDQRSG